MGSGCGGLWVGRQAVGRRAVRAVRALRAALLGLCGAEATAATVARGGKGARAMRCGADMCAAAGYPGAAAVGGAPAHK